MISRSGFTVNLASPDDVDDLVDLMEEFYAEANYPLDRPSARSSLLELMDRSEFGCIWLARSGGRAVGHVVLAVRYTMEHGGFSGYVDDLFVRPALRRRGVGRALLKQLFDECRARGCKSVQVEVGSSNTAALALYGLLGLAPQQDGRQLLSGAVFDGHA